MSTLRPTYFIDNEVMVKDAILRAGVYPKPIAGKGVAMVDSRDIAEVGQVMGKVAESIPSAKRPLPPSEPARSDDEGAMRARLSHAVS